MRKEPSNLKTNIHIVSIVGSSRKNGNTERFVKQVEERVARIASEQHVAVSFDHVSLGRMDIQFCRGCRVCFDRGEEYCPLKDTIAGIRDKLGQADGIILASPVYVEDVSGVLKNWIDRMAYHCHRPAFAGKVAGILTTSGMGASSHALHTMAAALNAWGSQTVCKANFKAGALIKDEEISAQYDKRLDRFAADLCKGIRHKSHKPSFYSLLAFKIQQKCWQNNAGMRDSVDYTYWESNGWLEPHVKYYIPYTCSHVKVAAARAMGHLLAVLLFH